MEASPDKVIEILNEVFSLAKELSIEALGGIKNNLNAYDLDKLQVNEIIDICTLSILEASLRSAAISLQKISSVELLTEEKIVKMLQAYRLSELDKRAREQEEL
jgi:hypothetical protein